MDGDEYFGNFCLDNQSQIESFLLLPLSLQIKNRLITRLDEGAEEEEEEDYNKRARN